MNMTDIFIRRPVLSMVISIMLLVLGLRSLTSMPVLQYPRTENAVVTVSTAYYGADPDIIAGFITTPLETVIAEANGIDYISSISQNGISTITANLRLNFDPNKALTEINAKVNSVINQLPPESQRPVMNVKMGETIDAMYIGFSSDSLPANNITDYLVRTVQPRLQSVAGIQTAELLGSKNFSLRAWLDPDKLMAYSLTATDVSTALTRNDFIAGLGTTKGQMVQVNLTASTGLHSVAEFAELIIKQDKGAIIRLKDVANVTLGADDYESSVSFDGDRAVYIGLQIAPSANLLEVIGRVRDVFPEIQAQLPQGIRSKIVYDSTKFVDSSIHEVIHTLIEALIIVTLVVFAFLGSPRSVLIPVIAIPLSLIGTFTMMLMFGFSINLLTLLALVLAIGLVVDDAIIVVENVNRHLEEGMEPIPAALRAAQELTGPIIAMTIVLIAVYVPVGFQSGLTGALFSEFAFTVVGAVTVSALVALTLSPMMSSRLLKAHKHDRSGWEERLVDWIDRRFSSLSKSYERALHGSLNYLPVTAVFALIILGSIYFLYAHSNSELAPQEDQGIIISLANTAPDATLAQRLLYSEQIFQAFHRYTETDNVFQLESPGQSISGMVLKPWHERLQTATQMLPAVQQDLNKIAGVKAAAFQPPPLPGSSGMPVQFIIGTNESFEQLNTVLGQFMAEVRKSGRFLFVDSDLRYDQPQARLNIDRDKAALLGLTMQDVGASLASMLGGGYVNYFSLDARSYKVIPQVQQKFRLNPEQLLDYPIRTSDGRSVQLSTIATLSTETVPRLLNHFQRINDVMVSGVPFPGVTLGDALATLQDIAKRVLPPTYSIDYAGQSRQLIKESSGFLFTFMFALIIIFLALAAQFESFRDPLIILVSVPMSIAGALIFIALGIGGATLNIYTEVGLVTLMGLISKHGILIVEFANNMQKHGMGKREAIESAASIRLRPILMTTAAMVLGVLPLILATGAGAVSRFSMGLVIATGIAIGTLFTLFVVPAVYLMLGEDHHKTAAES
ncbi:efflux RND transporter permease subunit [Methylovulum psychrotolerans]|jgi:multidrug efflux pump|uniref:efflux RND transporter permease subunit n=1 Tax=Methylovulum psychrotolerans TaxID=1704499 RepID=UPI001BFF20B9|nr:efflux RND transporter permease subunit [Methylovulum psychrotolerans]MBT9096676.1 efflux RND transporter permease subunit [Methylovulum psychrotolerans]